MYYSQRTEHKKKVDSERLGGGQLLLVFQFCVWSISSVHILESTYTESIQSIPSRSRVS